MASTKKSDSMTLKESLKAISEKDPLDTLFPDLDALKAAGADIVTIHNDIGLSEDELRQVLKDIHARGMKAAMSLKPKFPAETVFPFMGELDMVLIMTVEPGFGGQKFIEETYERVRVLKAEIQRQGLDIPIEVDGGVSAANSKALSEAGAEILVAGSAVFKAEDPAEVIAQIRGKF